MGQAPSQNARIALKGLLAAAIFLVQCVDVTTPSPEDTAGHLTGTSDPAAVQVALSAPHTTISWNERDDHQGRYDLPLAYLHRQRETTPRPERTLQMEMTGFAAQVALQVEAQSHHADVSTGVHHIITASFVTQHPCTPEQPCTLEWTLDAQTMPSDFYTIRVKDHLGHVVWENPDPYRPDFVALDTWDVALGEYTARVYYATLFPFARGQDDLVNRLPPAAVHAFIERHFVPIIEDTWHTQVEEWGFGAPLHPDWDADGVIDIIITAPPHALFGGTGTYTLSMASDGRPYPERRIWWLASNNCLQTYDSLENAYRAVFAHEFFHLMQLNLRLSAHRPAGRWTNLFIEAQGKFVPSVQYPEIELHRDHMSREGGEYVNAANRFLIHRLNSSYQTLEADPTDKYDLALYWRFLYEQYGDMDVVHAALEEMARHGDGEVVPSMAKVMDQALARVDGPFVSFEESLAAFSRANYALRLENGRCTTKDAAGCRGFYYDPDHLYVDPPLEARLHFDGRTLVEDGFIPTSSGIEFTGLESSRNARGDAPVEMGPSYNGSIPSSYGMDFIELRLDPTLHNRPLTVTFQASGSVPRFSVQVWKIGPGEMRPRALTPHPELLAQDAQGNGEHSYQIPQVDTLTYDRLGLIITRLDSGEAADPVGGYTITLESRG